ncbi:hypothetical protein PISL3812_07962 [Talaromyces islandicus]|uniref:Alpha/beta hydrolase fold-3 domain-containing protein n=1 Tax=Talaromyces islandicus TaxID=28573 RepID=A0A0U1M7L9_TALIS|nr:hypothetical protein PISL3812_07962 [Talaromyces islandicus]
MHLNTACVGASVTPIVISTWFSHYLGRKSRDQKPTAHLSYDEGLHVVRAFLKHAAGHTVEDIQAFTAQKIPTPHWVKIKEGVVPTEYLTNAADSINSQLGKRGITRVGGKTWWQWRGHEKDLKYEWIEMKSDYNARKRSDARCKRAMFYIHGGAYFFGSIDSHRYMMQRHARKLKARVFARTLDPFPFPCGLQDCIASYLYLLTIQDPSEIIVAGDSAGGGMLLSMLVILRDQGIPLPAGGILISPWVDLTHSFPSVASGSSLDYIPEHGFMHRPSQAWPPPNADDLLSIYKAAEEKKSANKTKDNSVPWQGQLPDHKAAVHGFTVRKSNGEKVDHTYPGLHANLELAQEEHIRTGKADTLVVPMQDNTVVEIKDQIQMYCPNQMLSHPLVSPILQPSLGGLPPLLILTGGGEMLRDEQIYLAHKAADPAAYPPMDAYLDEHDPSRTKVNQYEPTYVQLQVWEDLCHVGITLSWTKPAKFMFRSIAQFGAWALAHAQQEDIEIPKDDSSSISSSSLSSDLERDQPKGSIGKAGDPLPPFRKHIIRQKVDRHGVIYHLEPPHALPALQQPREKVGAISSTIVSKWLVAKKAWDEKFAKPKVRVQRSRIKDFEKGYYGFDDEIPPACAIASRRVEKDVTPPKPRKSYGMMLWSLAASRHDKEIAENEQTEDEIPDTGVTLVEAGHGQGTRDSLSNRDTLSPTRKRDNSLSRLRSRSRIVTDSGQTADIEKDGNVILNGPAQQQADHGDGPSLSNSSSTPVIPIPGLDTNASLEPSKFVDNASTRAILNEDGVINVEDNISRRPDTFSLSSTDTVPELAEPLLIRKPFQHAEQNSVLVDSVPQTPTSATKELMSTSSSIASTAAVRHAPGILKVEKPKIEGFAGDAGSNQKEHEVNVDGPKMPQREEFLTAEEY